MAEAEETKNFDFDNPRLLEKVLSGKELHQIANFKDIKLKTTSQKCWRNIIWVDFFGCRYRANGIKRHLGSPLIGGGSDRRTRGVGGGGGAKGPTISFSPVTSTNVEISPHNILTFSFNPLPHFCKISSYIWCQSQVIEFKPRAFIKKLFFLVKSL